MALEVFLSYTHESDAHQGRVWEFCERLRKDGIDCRIDQHEFSPPEGWPRWCRNRIRESKFVMVVCTETYNRRYEGKEEAGKGLGAKWEGFVITQELYDAEGRNTKFIPVVFASQDVEHIPLELRGSSRYDLSTKEGYDRLFRHLTGQPSRVKSEIAEEIRAIPPYEREQDFRGTSLAVLPFKNDDSGLDADYIASGLTDGITERLSRLRGLRVARKESIRRYAARDNPVSDAAKELGVATILEGQLKIEDTQIIVNVTLVDTKDIAGSIWTNRYKGNLAEPQDIESQIAVDIIEKLGFQPTTQEQATIKRHQTKSADAKRAYNEGSYWWNRRDPTNLKTALQHFFRAVQCDPQFAEAHLGLAQCYSVYGIYDLGSEKENGPKALQAADRALQLASGAEGKASAYATRGIVKATYQWDWGGAENDLRGAIELNPQDPTAHHWYALVLVWSKKPENALRMERQAVLLAPEEAVFGMTVGLILYYQGQYETSLQEYRKTLDRHPKFSTVHYYAGKSHQEMRHYDEAERYYLEDLKRSPERPLVLATLGNLYAIRGERGKARDILDGLHALSEKRYVSPYHYAIVEVGLGNHRSALKWLEQAENEKAFRIATTAVEPLLNPIRAEPGFQALLSRVGLAITE